VEEYKINKSIMFYGESIIDLLLLFVITIYTGEAWRGIGRLL
jgi:hypothetical protein